MLTRPLPLNSLAGGETALNNYYCLHPLHNIVSIAIFQYVTIIFTFTSPPSCLIHEIAAQLEKIESAS